MRIVFATGKIGYRGTPKAMAAYAEILSAVHEVRVWGIDEDASNGGDLGEMLRDEGIEVWIGAEGLDKALAFMPHVFNLHRPGIERARDSELFMLFHSRGVRCIETNVFGRVDSSVQGLLELSIHVSRWDLWQWNRWRGRDSGQVGVYCPNPVDCNRYKRQGNREIEAQRKKWGVPSGCIVVGRIGNTNWDVLCRPLLLALSKNRNLVVVNVADHSTGIPNQLLEHERFVSIPRLHGSEALCGFYSACDFLISMSAIGESFGYVNAEAMACGTPVIALSTPLHCNAQAEIVSPNVGGLTIAAPRYLTKAIELLLSEDRLQQCSQRARSLICSRYSYESIRPTLESIFSEGKGDKEGLECDVPTGEIVSLCRSAIGRYPIFTKFVFRLYYTHMAYRIVLFLKQKLSVVFRLARKLLLCK